MDIVVVGRHTDVPSRFRRHVEDKLSKVEQLAPYAQRVDVAVIHEPNPRQSEMAERIELTVVDKGPVIRAEASASDRYGALDIATTKLVERLRRARDRRKDYRKGAQSRTADPAPVDPGLLEPPADPHESDAPPIEDTVTPPSEPGETKETQLGDSPVLIRQKVHAATPMSVDDALYEMELVGHPFYLFVDAETGQPSAVYHRRGWSYGVIRLEVDGAASA